MRNERPLVFVVVAVVLGSLSCEDKSSSQERPSAAESSAAARAEPAKGDVARAPAKAPAPDKSAAAGVGLSCPAGQTAQQSAVLGGLRVSCFDEHGHRQGRSLRVDASGRRLEATSYKDDVEEGALTLWAAGGDPMVARGIVEGGRLSSFELVGEPSDLTALEERVRAELDRAQSCRSSADCASLPANVCPFGCSLPVHRAEAPRLRKLLEAYPRRCKQKCAVAGKVACVEQRCVTKYH